MYNPQFACSEYIVTGNVMDMKPIENIEDSGFDADEVKCSTKKSLEENLSNVWNLMNEKFNREENSLTNQSLNNYYKIPDINHEIKSASPNLGWVDNEIIAHESVISKSPEIHSESGVFKLSLDELSISEPEQVVKFHPEPEFSWNEGNVTTNAISEPWSFVNPYYIPVASNYEDFNEEIDDDSDISEDQSLLARLPPRPPTPPRSKKRFLPFNISNLLRHKTPRTS